MNYRIIRDQMDVDVRPSFTPISWKKKASSSLSPSGHIALKKEWSDEQRDEFIIAQCERVAGNPQRDYKGAGKDVVRRAKEDYLKKEDYWNSELEAICELEKVAQRCFQQREGTNGNKPSKTPRDTNNPEEEFKEIGRKIVVQFGKESQLHRYCTLIQRIGVERLP